MDGTLIFFGVSFIGVIAVTLLAHAFSRQHKIASSWSLFLLGSAIFVGLSAIEVVTKPRGYLNYDNADYVNFMFGTIVFYVTIYAAYYFLKYPRRLAGRHFNKWPSAEPTYLILTMVPFCIGFSLIHFVLPPVPFIQELVRNLYTPMAIAAQVLCLYAWDKDRRNPFIFTLLVLVTIFGVFIVLSSGTTARRPLFSLLLAIPITFYWLKWRYQALGKNVIRAAIGVSVIFVIIGAFTTFRHWDVAHREEKDPLKRAIMNFVTLPKAVWESPLIWKMINGQGAAEISLVAINRYAKDLDTEPFFTLKMIAVNPIPRRWWPGKPEALGTTLPRDIGRYRYGYVNFGPGIIGHGFHEGGYPMLIFYGVLFGLCFRFYDELLFRQSNNPYILAVLGAISGHVVAFSRGDIAVFAIQIISVIAAIGLMVFIGRFAFGTHLKYPRSTDNLRSRSSRVAQSRTRVLPGRRTI